MLLIVMASAAHLPLGSTPVPTSAAYLSQLDNAHLHAFRLELPPAARVPVYAAHHDQVWVAISPARLRIEREDGRTDDLEIESGVARFFPAHQIKGVANESGAAVQLAIVELKHSSDAAEGCQCTGVVAMTVCGCRNALRLPPLWAVSLGDVTLAGTTLNPGQSCCSTVRRGDTLLVAISRFEISYANTNEASEEIITTRKRVKLQPGEVLWLPGGRRSLVNTGEAPARCVSIELD